MKRKLSFAMIAAGTCLTLTVASASAAAADVIVPPTLTVAADVSTLTLPAGDGVRDIATITVGSDVATDVVVTVTSADGSAVLKTLPTVTVDAEGATQVPVDVAGLGAGAVSVAVAPVIDGAPAPDAAASVPLTIGSGTPTKVALSLSKSTIHTWSKATDRSSVATVSVRDETGLEVPFTGTVTATVAKKSQKHSVTSPTGKAAKATIIGTTLPAGTASVVATVTANGATARSAASKLTLKTVAVSAVKVTASIKTLYPAKDGYRDSVKLTVASTSTTGTAVPVTGKVTVTRGGKTVTSWKLSSSKKWSASWNGKVKGKIVPGTYTVTVSSKGPQGGAKKSSVKVTVKKGKLVSKTLKKTVKANTVLKKYTPADYDQVGACVHSVVVSGDFVCIGFDAYDLDAVSLIANGSVTVPSAVVSAQKYGATKMRMTGKVSYLDGAAAWGYGYSGDSLKLTELSGTGSTSAGWLGLPATTKKIDVILGLGEYTLVAVDTFTIEYRYKVMSGS